MSADLDAPARAGRDPNAAQQHQPEPETLAWATSVVTFTYRPRTAGPHGCDPCLGCRKHPPHGARIWVNCYGDIYCDPCARKRAAEHQQSAGQP